MKVFPYGSLTAAVTCTISAVTTRDDLSGPLGNDFMVGTCLGLRDF